MLLRAEKKESGMSEFLRGWREIGEYWASIGAPKCTRTLQMWVSNYGFPVFRSRIGKLSGRRVWSNKSMIRMWVLKNMKGLFAASRKRKGKPDAKLGESS